MLQTTTTRNKHSKELVEEIQLIIFLNFNGIPAYNLFTYP
jgi:hypothetical protein